MESSTAVLRLQSCSCPCKHSTSPYPGRVDYARQRVDSNSLAGSRHELGAPLNLRLSRRRLSTITRCLYSPLVESFEAPKTGSFVTKLDGSDGGLIRVSPSGLSVLKPAAVATARLDQDVVYQETIHRDDYRSSEQRGAVDDVIPSPQDPVAAAHGDSTLLATASDAGHDLEARKTARYHQLQTMSISQGFRAVANKGVNSAIGAAGRPIANASKIGGPAGLLMGLAVAGLGIVTAFQKASEIQPQQKFCPRCDGYGVECCDVCNGAGKISWEGKAHRTNTCPRCFGSCLKKCPRCDGCRAKKESTLVLQQLKTPSKSPPKKK